MRTITPFGSNRNSETHLHFEGLKENFHFLIVEVSHQIDDAISALIAPSAKLTETIQSRDDYIDSIKSVILKKTFRLFRDTVDLPKQTANIIQAVSVITNNLENIADYCTNIVDQTAYLSDIAFFHRFDIERFFDEIVPCLDWIEPALLKQDMDLALKICRCEFRLDELYKESFQIILRRLQSGKNVQNLITSLFIIRYLERIGDCLLNIGEAIISSAIGEKMKIHQFMALGESLEGENPDYHTFIDREFSFETIGETKSGCQIGRVRDGNQSRSQWALFKEGNAKKLRQEKESLEKWEILAPGLPPKIYAYREYQDTASLLLEYLEGTTFQEIMLDGDWNLIHEALQAIFEVVAAIWTSTRKEQPVRANFTRQLINRMEDVLRLHPDFNEPEHSIGHLSVPSLHDRLEQLLFIEEEIQPPFSVFIHGDFNTDNLLYNPKTGKVNFIDLHRSQDMDYVQDVSVFLVSNFRFPAYEDRIRSRLNVVSKAFYEFAGRFAVAQGDETFEARLALGLVRNFLSSTRFVLSDSFARTLFLRAKYLMEKVIAHQGSPWSAFRLPVDILIY